MEKVIRLCLVLLTVVFLLGGCTTLKDRPFDATEYDRAIRITVDVTRAIHQCVTPENPLFDISLYSLNTETMILSEYELNKPNSANQVEGVLRLRKLTQQFYLHTHPYSTEFCKQALSEIQSASRTLARVLSDSEKTYDMCDSDVMARFNKFQAAYSEGLINKLELEELAKGLLELKKLDVAGCSVKTAEELKAAIKLITQTYPYLSLL
jgi:hypothetical protein